MTCDDLEDDIDQIRLDQVTICRLYVFAEFLQDIRSKNKILSKLFNSVTCDFDEDQLLFLPQAEAVHIIWQGTKVDSPARDLILDAYASDLDCAAAFSDSECCESVSDFPTDFVAKIIEKLCLKRINDGYLLKLKNYQET